MLNGEGIKRGNEREKRAQPNQIRPVRGQAARVAFAKYNSIFDAYFRQFGCILGYFQVKIEGKFGISKILN